MGGYQPVELSELFTTASWPSNSNIAATTLRPLLKQPQDHSCNNRNLKTIWNVTALSLALLA